MILEKFVQVETIIETTFAWFALFFLASLPILILLGLMIFRHWGAHLAGSFSWLVAVGVAALFFGLTPQVWWVSQARGLLLSIYVLAVLWPALLLYHLVSRVGGISALAAGLQSAIRDRALLLVIVAWAFSGMLEGLAGFGLPVAVVSPMLVALGVEPVLAVIAVAVGHSWAVTFGDMGVVFQTLVGVTHLDAAQLMPLSGIMLGIVCFFCGIATVQILHSQHTRRSLAIQVVLISLIIALVQYGLAAFGLIPLSAFGAGLVGVITAMLISPTARPKFTHPSTPLMAALGSYGGLAALMTVITLPTPLRTALSSLVWQANFPQVITQMGFLTTAGGGQVFRPWVHPGAATLCVTMISYFVYRRANLCNAEDGRAVLQATYRSAMPASLGIVFTVGLSTLMDHTGMTQLLARGLAEAIGSAFPLISPLIGILGAFATGSNNNSNVLFAPLQKNAALLLQIDPRLLLAAQTAGGALGSMIAPAKITVGCSTVGLKGQEGRIVRVTLFYCLAIGLSLGGLALLWAKLTP